jgi:reticulon-4 receptor-like 1
MEKNKGYAHQQQRTMPSTSPGNTFLGATCGTAAVLALPPSIPFSLALPAQNTCASCNLTFRMTSDLVYHMRTHHKRQQEADKLRRGEKLKCPICRERFRERHHLTRHMTAHEDKNEELLEVADKMA